MNKKIYNSILLFMGMVLLTIIALQIVWINNIVAIRKKELSSNTQQALNNTVIKLQQHENSMALMDQSRKLAIDSTIVKDSVNWEEVVIIKSSEDQGGVLKSTTVLHMDSMERMNHMVRNVVYNYNNIESEPDIRQVSMIKMEKLKENLDSLAGQIIVQIESRSLHDRLHTTQVQEVLREQLKAKGIDVGFEFAVLNGDSAVIHSKDYIPSSMAMTFETKLFPNDIFDRDLKLVMYYPVPAANEYVFSKIHTSLILTGLFTLGILIAFYLTVRFIKKQKKIGDLKNDFINNITHEFKTPIATSAIAIAALENQQVRTDHEKFRYFTGILKEENQKMNQQVEKVLQLAMMDKGKLEVVLQEMDANEILQNAFNGFNLLLKENNIDASIQLDATHSMIKADPFHLIHVFNNIIDNAIKYRSAAPTLKVTTENKDGNWIARFVDNGKGMSSEVLKNAFETFYRGQKGNIHDVKGFGLGLSYAKNIIESCKGTIVIPSHVNKGTEVIITLPLA
jgi:two-component system, OmpR family, phosphate regulon sensor histidine kinase PhoR